MERTHTGVVHEGLSPTGGSHAGAGEECRDEGAAERSCYGLTAAPFPAP